MSLSPVVCLTVCGVRLVGPKQVITQPEAGVSHASLPPPQSARRDDPKPNDFNQTKQGRILLGSCSHLNQRHPRGQTIDSTDEAPIDSNRRYINQT